MPLTIKSIDTMKISRDDTSITMQEIQDTVDAYIGLGLTHLTIDCHFSGALYNQTRIENWITAVRNRGFKVWFRPGWSALTINVPQDFTDYIVAIINDHPTWFQSGDIYDMSPESTYNQEYFGEGAETRKTNWNQWLRDTKTQMDTELAANNITGVITGITSITDFTILNDVETDTFTTLGYACIDHYPGVGSSTQKSGPERVARAVASDLVSLYRKAQVPVVIGEFGFARQSNVAQGYQRDVLRAVMNEISNLDFVTGYNWWCGHGGTGFGDFCNLLEFSGGRWVERAALKTLGDFYKRGDTGDRMVVI